MTMPVAIGNEDLATAENIDFEDSRNIGMSTN